VRARTALGAALAAALTGARAAAAQSPAAPAVDRPAAGETLLDGAVARGGYGRVALFTGAEGAWLVNHRFVLGAGGFALATPNVRNAGSALRDAKGRHPALAIGYGGVILGYVHRPASLVHVGAQTLVGGGGVTYRSRDERPLAGAPDAAFFVAEPSAEVEMNVAPHVRVGVGAGYRLVSGLRFDGLSAADLRGAVGALTVKVGRF
jgi:hypothetical protein